MRCWRLYGIINIIFWFTDYPSFWLLVFAFEIKYNNLEHFKPTYHHFISEW